METNWCRGNSVFGVCVFCCCRNLQLPCKKMREYVPRGESLQMFKGARSSKECLKWLMERFPGQKKRKEKRKKEKKSSVFKSARFKVVDAPLCEAKLWLNLKTTGSRDLPFKLPTNSLNLIAVSVKHSCFAKCLADCFEQWVHCWELLWRELLTRSHRKDYRVQLFKLFTVAIVFWFFNPANYFKEKLKIEATARWGNFVILLNVQFIVEILSLSLSLLLIHCTSLS